MTESNYQKLRKINVNEHTEKKGELTYLSWAWAVDQLLLADPDANWSYGEPKMYVETMMVFCSVTAFGKTMTAQLPVMDHRNKPIPSPDAFQVNTAMQRCLAKAIALQGLGLYIYAGEDMPPEVKEDHSEKFNQVLEDIWSAESFDVAKLPDTYFGGNKELATEFWKLHGKTIKAKK